MAYREPGDPRCKDCPEPHQRGRARCVACELAHRRATRLRRLDLRKRRLCLVCSAPVVKRPAWRRYCRKHLRYYAARAAAVGLLLLAGCAGRSFETGSDVDNSTAGAGSPSVAGSGGAVVAGAPSLSGSAGASGVAGTTLPGNEGGNSNEGGAGLGGDGGAGGAPPSSAPVTCDRSLWSLEAFASNELEPPALALDGSTETRWSSGVERAAGQWLALELGAVVELGALELVGNAADLPPSVALELDGHETPATLEPMEGGVRVTFEATPASSARLELVSQGSSWWSVAELGGVCFVR